VAGSCVHGDESSGTTEGEFLEYLSDSFSEKDCAAWSWLVGLSTVAE
jgi:hypothetical protein